MMHVATVFYLQFMPWPDWESKQRNPEPKSLQQGEHGDPKQLSSFEPLRLEF